MKTFDKKTYMREYKRKQYGDPLKSEQLKKNNMIRYYKKRYGNVLGDDVVDTYGLSIPIVLKLQKAVKDIMNSADISDEQKELLLGNVKALIN
tara:strand:+ start:6636 stop:6914 length:279 start_codon:yes stop_codon:yes gene_type:complete